MGENLSPMQETCVCSLGWEDFLGEGNGYPFQVFLPGKFHVQRSLTGYSSWGLKELEMMKRFFFFLYNL